MKYFILKVPTFLWLLTLTILGNFFLYSLFPNPFVSYFLIVLGNLAVSSIHISNKIYDENGQYSPLQTLWWWVLGFVVISIVMKYFFQTTLTQLFAMIIFIILGGFGYRLIEHFAMYRYHYLEKERQNRL